MVKKFKNKKIWSFLLIGVIAIGTFSFLGNKNADKSANSIYETEEVMKQDIFKSLSGSGTLKPANSYTVVTLVEGDILKADFEEGDIVEKDTVLYEIDSSNVSKSIEKAQIALNQAKRNYDNIVEKQYIESSVKGQVYTLNVEVGDDITQGEVIGVVRDSDVMELKLPFPTDDALTFTEGQIAMVTLNNTFETIEGVITNISGSDIIGQGNMITRMITIEVDNPGGLTEGLIATASVNGLNSAGNSSFAFKAEKNIVSTMSGTIVELYVEEGSKINKNQRILKLGGDAISDQIQGSKDSLRNAELSMEGTEEQLENYTITSPISGTIVDKKYKTGDTVSSGKQVCTIYDLSYLEMNLNIDELDISNIFVGQEVVITADAVIDKEYKGVITKVSVAGTTTNGITSYPVTIRLDNIEGLLPGMNANADIGISKVENVIAIPNIAVERGDLVLITKESPSAVNPADKEAPEGYVYVKVETGLSDEDSVEIVSGLQMGDIVAYIPENTSSGIDALLGQMR